MGIGIEYVVEVSETGQLVRRPRDGRRVEFVVEVLDTGALIGRTRDDQVCAIGDTLSALRAHARAAIREALGEDRPFALVVGGSAT